MLEINNLSVEVGGKRILTNINLRVEMGYTHVLFGPNGAGKSALLMTIMGFSGYNAVEGEIIFKGEDITHMPVNERAKLGIGVMTQRPPNMTGIKLGEFVKLVSKKNIDPEELARPLDMIRFLDRDINVGFSGGEIKRSELLQLAAQKPDLYLLDEPESGVDLVSIEQIGYTIKELLSGGATCAGERSKKGKSALIITHTGQILDYVEADRGCVLSNGMMLCTGNPRELLNQIKSKGYKGCIRCNREMS